MDGALCMGWLVSGWVSFLGDDGVCDGSYSNYLLYFLSFSDMCGGIGGGMGW